MKWSEICNEEILYMREDMKDFTLKNPSLKELVELTKIAYDEFEKNSNITLNNNEYGCVRAMLSNTNDYYFAPSTYRIHGEIGDSLNLNKTDIVYFTIQLPRNQRKFSWHERRGLKTTPYLATLGLK